MALAAIPPITRNRSEMWKVFINPICLLAQYLEIMKMAAISTITRNQRGIAKEIVPWLPIWLLIY